MRVTEERRGRPDRSRVGSARRVDTRRATRNDLRRQHGYDFGRLITPGWSTANRPTLPVAGDAGLNTDSGRPETYDGTGWVVFGSQAVTFTATGSYTYAHSRGTEPSVSVVLASGIEVEVEVDHTSENSVTVFFNGTITDGVLILS